MTWWGWALVGGSLAFAGLCYAVVWLEKALPGDDGVPRRWR